MHLLHKNYRWRANSPGNHTLKLQALANRFLSIKSVNPEALTNCSRLKKSKQPKPYITYRMSGFMLTILLAGFLSAKQGGFLQLACLLLHPSRSWPTCLLLGFCFLIMRLLTVSLLCLNFFFPRRNQGKNYILHLAFLVFCLSQYQSWPCFALSCNRLQ